MSDVALRRASNDDIAFIMRVERQPGYDSVVGRWDEAEHAHVLALSDNAYLIGLDGDQPRGFAILMDVGDANGNVHVKRIAILDPGKGFGKRFVAGVLDWIYRETGAHRVWLNVFSENHRAQRAYAKCGFVEEGVQRQIFLRPDGTRADLRLMSILRPEWETLRRSD